MHKYFICLKLILVVTTTIAQNTSSVVISNPDEFGIYVTKIVNSPDYRFQFQYQINNVTDSAIYLNYMHEGLVKVPAHTSMLYSSLIEVEKSYMIDLSKSTLDQKYLKNCVYTETAFKEKETEKSIQIPISYCPKYSSVIGADQESRELFPFLDKEYRLPNDSDIRIVGPDTFSVYYSGSKKIIKQDFNMDSLRKYMGTKIKSASIYMYDSFFKIKNISGDTINLLRIECAEYFPGSNNQEARIYLFDMNSKTEDFVMPPNSSVAYTYGFHVLYPFSDNPSPGFVLQNYNNKLNGYMVFQSGELIKKIPFEFNLNSKQIIFTGENNLVGH